MAEVFEVRNISFSYGDRHALKDVNLNVAEGESLAVLGANGSGKTTLLKILDGLVWPTSGAVSFRGVPVTEGTLSGEFLSRFRSSVGFVFSESDVQLFNTTVFDELAFGPLQLGLGPAEVERRVEDLLASLGIEHLRDRAPYELSTGEKRKVAIGSVLAVDPEVLLLDEPTGGLDPRSQVWLFEVLTELKALGRTVVMSTHDLSLVEDFSERVVVLDETHTVAAEGPKEEIINDRDLLLRVNIIHEHAHRHGDVVHTHSHGPWSVHDEHE